MRARTAFAAASLVAVALAAAGAFSGQEGGRPAPLARFVEVFTDPGATSAQKEVTLPSGTWYTGTITVSDVEFYRQQGKDPERAEIKDYNYAGGCYLLIFRTPDTAAALKLRVGDRALVSARLKDIGVHLPRFVSGCETRFALFTECEILEVLPAAR